MSCALEIVQGIRLAGRRRVRVVLEADRDPRIGKLDQVFLIALDALQLRLHGDSASSCADGAIGLSDPFSQMILPPRVGRRPPSEEAPELAGTGRRPATRTRPRAPPKGAL